MASYLNGQGTAVTAKILKPAGAMDLSSMADTKRKRAAGGKFYSVRVGHSPGIYDSWDECFRQVKGFKAATFKSFTTLSDAQAFLRGEDPSRDAPTKFYAVRSGHTPGIYTDWPSAQKQILGWHKPKQRSFASREEADKWLKSKDLNDNLEGQENGGINSDVANRFVEAAAPVSAKPTVKAKKDPLPPAKRPKKSNGPALAEATRRAKAPALTSIEIYNSDEVENGGLGTGPLPPGSVDGFDSTIRLDEETTEIHLKTEEERNAIKTQLILKESAVLKIYTDGSSLGNGSAEAAAGVGVYFGPSDSRNVSERLPGRRQTNQRAELTAIFRALEISPRNRDICIYTDSKYAIDCVTSWHVKWRQNNWQTAAGKAVENKDLVMSILDLMEARQKSGKKVDLHWLKGHANHEGNVEADKLAVNGARKGRARGKSGVIRGE
ncbi:MAG: hypothetical protein M1829_003597 [Trizodia sp. TS-e1964]|nr:MAG: hypothetical protein M1829_003597 [Trizodia sp. TS-e1964]